MSRKPIILPDLRLARAERQLCVEALKRTGSLVAAAELLGTNRHALRRLIAKHSIEWWPYAQQQGRWRLPHAKSVGKARVRVRAPAETSSSTTKTALR